MSTSILEQWRMAPTEDKILKKELQGKDQHLAESFSSNICFDTKGVQATMGAGTNKMNEFTVAVIAQAYALFLIKTNKKLNTKEIVIGHDNRNNSALFSEVAARVLMNNGIKTKLYFNNESQPLPLISYTVRKLKLAGALIFTTSNKPKEYNGLKIYGDDGAQLPSSSIELIQKYMNGLDPLKVIKAKDQLQYLSSEIVEQYISDSLAKTRISKSKKPNIKIAFSPLHGTSAKIVPKILSEMNIEHYIVEKQATPDGDFSATKSTDIENPKTYDKVLSLARKKKADAAIAIDSSANKLGVVVKYQRRYKYLNGNQLAALYLDYKLSEMKKEDKIPKDGYIVKTVASGNLPQRIAGKYGIKVYEAHVGFQNVAKLIKNTKGTFIMGYEDSYGFLLNESLVRDKDAIQATIGVVEMLEQFKFENKDAYTRLKELYRLYGIHRTIKNSIKIDSAMSNRLMKNILKLKKLGNRKIIEKLDFRKDGILGLEAKPFVKIILEDNSWVAVNLSEDGLNTDIYIQTIGAPDQELIDVVVFEKEIESIIDENTESYPEKTISKRTIFKYFIFAIIMAVTIYIVFRFIYDGSKTKGDTFEVAKKLFTSNSRWIFLIGFVAYFFPVFLHAFQKKRLISAFGQKVKWRHLAISSFMGSFVSWITPFAVGGDAIGYWFLRRKGFKRGPLASSFLMGTIIYQFQIVLVSAILLPMGIVMFHDQIFNGSAEMRTIITLFIIGASWNLFATFMIYMLTFNRRFQEWIVKTAIKLLEWLPFVRVQDPGRLAATHQFTFYEIRIGMKKLWKRKLLLLECTFYETVTSFVNFYILIPILLGIVCPDLQYGSYFSPIVANDIIGTANSYSITPGGSGTGEYISMTVNSYIYLPVTGSANSSATATALDFLMKITIQWPLLIGSMISIIVIVAGEKRTKKYKLINNNNKLKGIDGRFKTTFYKKVSIPLLLLLLTYFLIFFLIF